MKLIIIAAMNTKGVIGAGGKIPWHIPEDVKRFKELTMGHAVLMGRKTYESIGRMLPGRRNIVVTSDSSFTGEHYPSIGAALAELQQENIVFIIGGGEIFRQTIGLADELLLTMVENAEEGDVFFPEYEPDFELRSREEHRGYAFLDYIRKRS